MNKPVIREDFKTADFTKIKKYNRLYFNSPVDIIDNPQFRKLPYSSQAFYQYMCRISFLKSNTNGWFVAPMKYLTEFTGMDERTIRRAKKELFTLKFLDIGRAYEHDSNIHKSDCYRINGFTVIVPEEIPNA